MRKSKMIVLALLLLASVLLLASCGDSAEVKALKEKYATAEVGDSITFGAYEQDNDNENGKEPVEWRVVAKEENRLLLVSEKALDFKPYNETDEDTTWADCTLRKWLNDDFLKAAFSKDEQSLIPTVTLENENNFTNGTKGGDDTKDKVFLLTAGEAVTYLYDKSDRHLEPTSYAKRAGDWSWSRRNEGYCWWWLRGPGGEQDVARGCNYGGDVYGDGVAQINAVRPAVWIELAD